MKEDGGLFMQFELMNFLMNPFVLMFTAVIAGILFGKIKFGKFSFGISGTLFTGCLSDGWFSTGRKGFGAG